MRLVQVASDHYRTDDGTFEVQGEGPLWVVRLAGEPTTVAEATTKREAVAMLASMILSEATSH